MIKPLKPDTVRFPTRGAHGRFFLDQRSRPIRMVKFPFYPDVTYWHRPTGLWDWIVRVLTRMERRGVIR